MARTITREPLWYIAGGYGNRSPVRQIQGIRPGRARRGLPQHLPLPAGRRQGNPAQAAEQDLLPDQQRRPRGRDDRGRDAGPPRVRLVRLLLPRPGLLPPDRRDPLRDVPPVGRGERRPLVRRAPDARTLGLASAEPDL